MKKTFKVGMILALISFAATSFIACKNDDDDDESETVSTFAGVEVENVNLNGITNLELKNYSYKVVFSVPAADGENWTASLAFDENDFETDNDGNTIEGELYELGSLSNTQGTGGENLHFMYTRMRTIILMMQLSPLPTMARLLQRRFLSLR